MPTKHDPDARAMTAVVASLTDTERAVLPSRLRALVADPLTVRWNAAKADRDAAITAAYVIEDLDERTVALEAAREAWAAAKADLLAEQEG